MAIKRPDIYEHNNPAYAIADSNFVRGGIRSAVADLASLYTLSGNTDQLKEHSTIVYVTGETKYYILVDIANVGNLNGWNEFQTGGGTGTITGGTNGLSTSGVNIVLGGTLTGTTTINASGQTVNITSVEEFQVSTSGSTTVLGVDSTGLAFTFSGGSLTFDDGGGLKYGGDYSSGYTAQSIPDVNYVTGLTSGFLKLDQTIPQDICNGQPMFHEGLILHSTPQQSLISGHTRGKMYYDDDYETISVDIGTGSTLQIGQEMVRWVYNATGIDIPDGSLVYTNGVHSSGGVDTVTVALAIATGVTSASIIGMATQLIPNNGYGFITTHGNINGLNTLTHPQYSGMTVGDIIYLSPTIFGGVTNVQPTSPNINIVVGRLLTKDVTNGKIFVDIIRALSLNDLTNVSVPTPSLDEVLKFNGSEWVNASLGAVSAGAGMNYYYSTPIINSRISPAGISADGTSGNGIQIATFSKVPVTTGGTLIVAGLSASDSQAFAAWEREDSINRTLIDAGTWEFYNYVNVNTVVGTTYLVNQMYQVVPITGSTITISGAGANNRTATITSSQFAGTYFSASTINTNGSYLRTPSGIYLISGQTSANVVNIVVPTGYVNETGVTGSVWNKLFGATSLSIEDTTPTLYETIILAPAFTIAPTDKLGSISFVSASGAYTLSISYNGTTNASFITTPFITLHNDLAGLQGGTGSERYHITLAELTNLNNQSGFNTGDETKSTIESKLIGTITTHTHPYSGLTGLPSLNDYQTVSGFTGYTASTANVINNAITGATNFGTGTTIYSGTTDRNIYFNTLIGSGGTTVQKVGNEIIITSLDAISGQLYSGQTPSAIDLGGISIGYELTGKTVSCIIQDLLVPELFGTITEPSISIQLTCTGIKEIGCNLSQTVQGTFNQGSINPQYCSISDKRSGLPNAYLFTGTGMPVPWQLCTNLIASQTNASYTVISGSQSWGVQAQYDAGYPALGSKGTQYCAALPSGCTTTATNSLTGILPFYYGTHSSCTITSAIITGGTKVISNVITSTPICFNATNEYLWFAAPACAATKTKWWVCAANAGDIGGTGNLWATCCNVNVTSGQGCWAGCAFDVYVTCGITTTATNTPMCLYY